MITQTINRQIAENTGGNGGLMDRLKGLGLKAKVMGLLAALVLVSLVAILFLEYQVLNGKTAIDSQKTDLEEFYMVQDATASFSDVRYWYTEIAVSLSEEASAASEASAALFVEKVNLLKSVDEITRATILKNLDSLKADAEEALMSYTFEENEAGKKSMAKVRDYIAVINGELAKLMEGARVRSEQAAIVVDDASTVALIGGIVMLVLVMLVACAIIVAMNAMILQPLVRITNEMKHLADGDTNLKLIDAEKTDEVGEMARAVQVFCQNSLKIKTMNSDQEQAQKEREAEREAAEAEKQATEAQQREEIEAQLDLQRKQAEAIKTLLMDKVHATLTRVVDSAAEI